MDEIRECPRAPFLNPMINYSKDMKIRLNLRTKIERKKMNIEIQDSNKIMPWSIKNENNQLQLNEMSLNDCK